MEAPFQTVLFFWSDQSLAEQARDIRFEVFVHEQGVPAEEELDAIDATALHVLVSDAAGTAIATGRMFADEHDPTSAHIGRMAVRAPWRRKGAGRAVITALLQECARQGFRTVELSAQTHAIPFYERNGFAAYGPEYDDCGIPHRMMKRALSGL